MRLREHALSERSSVTLKPSLATLLGGVALVLAALTFGASSLLVAGVAFALLGIVTPAWVALCARGADVRRRLGERRVLEDEPLEVTIEVRRGLLGLPGAEILDPLGGAGARLSEPLPVVGGSRSMELRVVTRAHRRGRHLLTQPSLLLSDPLGLARVTKVGAGPADELLVLPRTEPVRWAAGARRRTGRGAAGAPSEPLGAGEIDGLRPYVPGAPASRIHWPALARGAGLLERRLITEPRASALVVLDARAGSGPDAEAALDAAVRAAASITLELARAGGCGILLPGLRQPIDVAGDLVAWPGVHTRLALVQPGNRSPALRSATTGLTILVATRIDEQARAASRAFPGGLVLVVPAAAGERLGQPASFEVAGCAGYLLARRGARRGRAA